MSDERRSGLPRQAARRPGLGTAAPWHKHARRWIALGGLIALSACDCDKEAEAACATYPNRIVLAVPHLKQQFPLWCWAASLQMITSFHAADAGIEQCRQATDELATAPSTPPGQLPYCCDPPAPAEPPPDCHFATWPNFVKYNYNVTVRRGPLSWCGIKREISQNRPFAFSLTTGEGAHMEVVTGYKTDGDARFAYTLNPIVGGQAPTNTLVVSPQYEEYFSDYDYYKDGNGAKHGKTFYAISRSESGDAIREDDSWCCR